MPERLGNAKPRSHSSNPTSAQHIAKSRPTVTKNIVEITGRAYGTVRGSLQRFERLGFIQPNRRIGRSELYVPTPKLKKYIDTYARSFWTALRRSRAQKSRVKDPA